MKKYAFVQYPSGGKLCAVIKLALASGRLEKNGDGLVGLVTGC
jgi:hypothetical protein